MKNQRSRYATRLSTLTVLLALASSVGCRPGYLRASDLESSGQGPAACAKSCEDLGMRMGALVLVSNSLPGCVCQPVVAQTPPAVAPAVAPPAVPAVAPPPASPPVAPGATPAAAPASSPTPTPSPTPTSALPADSVGAQAAAVTTGFVVLAAAAAVQQGEQEHQRRAQAIVY